MKSGVGIFIDGCHQRETAWEYVMWGNPPEKIYGRIPRGLDEALHRNADFIYWGGMTKEAETNFFHAITHGKELPQFSEYGCYDIEAILRKRSVLGTAQNTSEEIKRCLDECNRWQIRELYLVSSPGDIELLHREVLSVLASRQSHKLRVYACASDTKAEFYVNDNVLVLLQHTR